MSYGAFICVCGSQADPGCSEAGSSCTWMRLHALASSQHSFAWHWSQVYGGNALLHILCNGILQCCHIAEGLVCCHEVLQLCCTTVCRACIHPNVSIGCLLRVADCDMTWEVNRSVVCNVDCCVNYVVD